MVITRKVGEWFIGGMFKNASKRFLALDRKIEDKICLTKQMIQHGITFNSFTISNSHYDGVNRAIVEKGAEAIMRKIRVLKNNKIIFYHPTLPMINECSLVELDNICVRIIKERDISDPTCPWCIRFDILFTLE